MRNQLHLFMKDYLSEIELAGLTSRIKRLSDAIIYSTRDYYKSVDLDIEPNWHLFFLLLDKNNSLTLTEISEELRMSHPACVKIIHKMKNAGYIKSKADKTDSRKQILSLTQKSKDRLPVFHKHWDACIETMKEITIDSPNFLRELSNVEQKINEKSYKDRTLKNFNNQ